MVNTDTTRLEMRSAQLRLVTDAPAMNTGTSTDPTRQVFEHWLYMLGRSSARCKLGPTRRAAINGALAIGYDVETLFLAVEGMAGDPLEGCTDRMRGAMRELEWLLASEARIEQWADKGDALRQASAQAQRRPVAAEAAPQDVDPAAAAAARERLRAFAAARREAAR